MLKVKALTLETSISQYVIPGIERVLQNSPDLKKVTVHTWHCNAIVVYQPYRPLFIFLSDFFNCYRD